MNQNMALAKKKIHLFQYGTGIKLATIGANELNDWCDAYNYLPHHKVGGLGWVVIAK